MNVSGCFFFYVLFIIDSFICCIFPLLLLSLHIFYTLSLSFFLFLSFSLTLISWLPFFFIAQISIEIIDFGYNVMKKQKKNTYSYNAGEFNALYVTCCYVTTHCAVFWGDFCFFLQISFLFLVSRALNSSRFRFWKHTHFGDCTLIVNNLSYSITCKNVI